MKRIISLLLTLVLLLGCTALAEAPATETVTLPGVGLTFEVPADWYYAVAGQSEGSSMAKLFGLPGVYLDAYLEQQGYTFYATLDAQETSRLAVIVAPGTALVDMRKEGVDMDALMEGFLQTFSAGEVVDSRVYQTAEGAFARIHCVAPVEGGTANLLVYACNTNATIYVFNFVAFPGGEFPEAELDAIVNSVDFPD